MVFTGHAEIKFFQQGKIFSGTCTKRLCKHNRFLCSLDRSGSVNMVTNFYRVAGLQACYAVIFQSKDECLLITQFTCRDRIKNIENANILRSFNDPYTIQGNTIKIVIDHICHEFESELHIALVDHCSR